MLSFLEKGIFRDVMKDLGAEELSWITQVGPKCHHKHLPEGETEEKFTHTQAHACSHIGEGGVKIEQGLI